MRLPPRWFQLYPPVVLGLPLSACSGPDPTPYGPPGGLTGRKLPPPVDQPEGGTGTPLDPGEGGLAGDAGAASAAEGGPGAGCSVSWGKDVFPNMASTGHWRCSESVSCHGGSQ